MSHLNLIDKTPPQQIDANLGTESAILAMASCILEEMKSKKSMPDLFKRYEKETGMSPFAGMDVGFRPEGRLFEMGVTR